MVRKKKIKVLIFGGTGFIGYHLAKKFIKKGWKVTSVSKKLPKKEKYIKGVYYKRIDLEKIRNYYLLKKNYDYLINASGYINNNKKDKYKEHNYKIVKNIFLHFKDSKIKAILNFGTSAEYGGKNSPQKEIFKCKPETSYGKDKLKCTNFLNNSFKVYGFPVIIFRPYQVYGPLQETNRLIPIAAKCCYFDEEFKCIDGSQIRDYLYVEDLVNAASKALQNPKAIGQIYNLGSGKKISIKHLVNYIKDYYKRGKPIYGKIKLRKDESKNIYPDISKIKKKLKWKPKTTLKKGLEKTLKYYKKKYSKVLM